MSIPSSEGGKPPGTPSMMADVASFVAELQTAPAAKAKQMAAKLVGKSPDVAVEVMLDLLGKAKVSGSFKSSAVSPAMSPAAPAADADNGEKLAEAKECSCLLPRGKFDLAITANALSGTAKAQQFRVDANNIVQLVCLPKGESVKPVMLVIARLRTPCEVTKSNGKTGSAKHIVMQVTEHCGCRDSLAGSLTALLACAAVSGQRIPRKVQAICDGGQGSCEGHGALPGQRRFPEHKDQARLQRQGDTERSPHPFPCVPVRPGLPDHLLLLRPANPDWPCPARGCPTTSFCCGLPTRIGPGRCARRSASAG